jgi:ABC-2 type transport system permease protein
MTEHVIAAAPGGVPRPVPQPSLWTVLTPKWRGALARLREERSGAPTKMLLIGAIGTGFWSAVFAVAFRVLKYTRDASEIGGFLPGKVLGMALVAFGSILLLSNLITALSTFFLAKDLDLLVAAPVDWLRLYLAKLAETIAHSSWMVGLLAAPVLAAYGIVFNGGPLFPFVALAALLPFIVLPAVVGTATTLLLVNIFPARRTRDLLTLVSIGGVGVVVVMLRFLQPEQLARPEGFRSLVDFLVALRTPTSAYLPSEWAARMIMNWLQHVADPLPVALLWTTAAAFTVMGAGLHRKLYRPGFTKAQEGSERFVRGSAWGGRLDRLAGRLPVSQREFILKDLRLFFRDTTQWSQLILLAVLLLVYVFNIKALPLFSGERLSFYLVTAIVFLNQGLAGFVLAAIAARFVFPAVSLEGRQLWLLRSSPLDLRQMVWSKYWIGTLPLLIVALFITLVTDALLHATVFMTVLSVGTLLLFTLAASALALCFGAYFPRFDTENAAQIPTSFGGLAFMMASVTLLAAVIALEARPVLRYIQAHRAGDALVVDADLIVALTGVAVLCLSTIILSLRAGLRRVEQLEG